MCTQSPVSPGRRELYGTTEQHRELISSRFNFEAGAGAIYDKYMADIEEVMGLLAKFHDFDEALLRAWKDSGIESGLGILYDAIDIVRLICSAFVWIEAKLSTTCIHLPWLHPLFPHTQYDNVWQTITDVFQATLGDLLEFVKSIIDKVGLCMFSYYKFD